MNSCVPCIMSLDTAAVMECSNKCRLSVQESCSAQGRDKMDTWLSEEYAVG